jgi:hypothetical protein
MWQHHLQIISLYIFTCSLFILHFLQSGLVREISSVRMSSRENGQIASALKGFVAPTFVLILLISNSGAYLPVKPSMPIENWLKPKWSVPSEIQMLANVSSALPSSFSFARLGMNDDSGLGALIKPQWKFVCKRLAIMGHEPLPAIEQFLDCLETVPDVILVAPFYESQSGRAGNYQKFFLESKKILSEKFDCKDFSNGYKYCLKKI